MADRTRLQEKEMEDNYPMTAGYTTAQPEPVATEPITADSDQDSSSFDEKNDKNGKDVGETIMPVMSRRSVATSKTTDSEKDQPPPKRSWSSRINPLKRNPPPVPKERIVSREYKASWISRLVFQWVQPLMTVSYL
jgi:ATP-binding cassette subfamily C (CFTR/MRP) protein 1